MMPRPLAGRRALRPGHVVGKIFDPIALAFKAADKLNEARWPGLELMPTKFLWEIVDAEPKAVGSLVEGWVTSHRESVADDFANRLVSYEVDDLASRAMSEAVDAFRRGHDLSVVRVLMPEVERFGRMILRSDGTLPRNQKQAVESLKSYIGSIAVTGFSPIESATMYAFLERDLFATCYTVVDATQLGPVPNRHAELHGLMSYGDPRGSTIMLGIQHFLLRAFTLSRGRARARSDST